MKENKQYYWIATESSSLYTIKHSEGLKKHTTQGFRWIPPNKISEPVYKGDYLIKEGELYYIDRIDGIHSVYDTKDPNKDVLVHLKNEVYIGIIGIENQLTDKDIEELIYNKELVEIPEILYDKECYLKMSQIAERKKISDIFNLEEEIRDLHSKDFSFDKDFSRKDLEEIKKAKQIQFKLEVRDADFLQKANKYLEEYISNEKELIIAKSFEEADLKFIYSVYERHSNPWKSPINIQEADELYQYSQKVYESAKKVFDIEITRFDAKYITNMLADNIWVGYNSTEETLATPISQVIEDIQRIIKNQEEQNIETNDESVEETTQGEDEFEF